MPLLNKQGSNQRTGSFSSFSPLDAPTMESARGVIFRFSHLSNFKEALTPDTPDTHTWRALGSLPL
jgi:hypothetical protein